MPRGGGAEAISPPHVGQFRRGHEGVSTKAVGLSHGAKPRVLQSSVSSRPTSQRPSSNTLVDLQIQCPDEYRIYQKEDQDTQKVEKKDAKKDYEKMVAKNGEVNPVHVTFLVNSKSWNEGGYPTGEAPHPTGGPCPCDFSTLSYKP